MLSKSYKLVTALLLATYVTTGAYAADKEIGRAHV